MRSSEEIYGDCLAHGICAEYGDRWNRARSRKELYDILCSMQGMEYVCGCLKEGYGPTAGELSREFGNFINGRFVSVQNPGTEREYDSCVWVSFHGRAEVGVTCAAFFGCTCEVCVIPWHVCHIYCDPSSRLSLDVPPTSKVYLHTCGTEGFSRNIIMKKD